MGASEGLSFRKSSYSGAGDCVLWVHDGDTVYVSDSKRPEGPLLRVSAPQWVKFTTDVLMEKTDQRGDDLFFRRQGRSVRVYDSSGQSLSFNEREWVAFRRGVAAREVYAEHETTRADSH